MKRFLEKFEELFDDLFSSNSSLMTVIMTLVLAITTFALVTKVFNDGTTSTSDIKPETFKVLILVLTGLVSILPLLVRFLNNDRQRKYRLYDELTFLERRREEKELDKSVTEHFKNLISKNSDLVNLEQIIKTNVTNNLESSIISKLESKYEKNIEHEYLVTKITETLNPITRNTEIYIDRIQRNSIVNLVIGIIGTVTAISILAVSILSEKSFTSLQDFFMHFIPRFTFVVFIQLFAFFFMRLYKNNLEDAKYFQNELSNLTAKSVSLKIALLTKNTERMNEVIKDLSSMERNFKLFKDETLHNLENKKIEKDLDENILNQLKDLVSKIDIKK